MKQGMLLKLLAINVPVVALVILVLWLVLDTLAADYFSVLMKEYRINPTDAHQMFIHSVHRYLLWTSIGALLLGALLSFLLTQMALRPLYQMIKTTRLIAMGIIPPECGQIRTMRSANWQTLSTRWPQASNASNSSEGTWFRMSLTNFAHL